MQSSDIESIDMRVSDKWGKTKAFASITFANGLRISGWKVLEGAKGLFVGSPSIQRKDKESGEMKWENICYIEDEDNRRSFQEIVLAKYQEERENARSFRGKSKSQDEPDPDNNYSKAPRKTNGEVAGNESEWWQGKM